MMVPSRWTTEARLKPIRLFEAQHRAPDAAALIVWAAWAVDSLNYLNEIDRAYQSNPPIEDQWRDIIDVSHARWATATSLTALDLCAAGLARVFDPPTGDTERALAHFDPYGKNPSRTEQTLQRLVMLPVAALDWIVAALEDPRHTTIKQARNSLTHARMDRVLGLGRMRLQSRTGASQIEVRELIETARDYATDHVSGLLQQLPNMSK